MIGDTVCTFAMVTKHMQTLVREPTGKTAGNVKIAPNPTGSTQAKPHPGRMLSATHQATKLSPLTFSIQGGPSHFLRKLAVMTL